MVEIGLGVFQRLYSFIGLEETEGMIYQRIGIFVLLVEDAPHICQNLLRRVRRYSSLRMKGTTDEITA